MVLPVAPNTISLGQVNTELGLSASALISLNDTAVRNLAGVASGAISMSNLHGKSAVAPPGQLTYTSGAFTFVVPTGITQVSTVNIGGGGGATHGPTASYKFGHGAGGGGGALVWANNVATTPGASISFYVGYGGNDPPSTYYGYQGWAWQAFYGYTTTTWPQSYWAGAGGPAGGATGGAGGGYTSAGVPTKGGGAGGAGGNSAGGGGGAGGYTGAGGAGRSGQAGAGASGAGGGSGGGGSFTNNATAACGGGGGTGLLGAGASGAGGRAGNPGPAGADGGQGGVGGSGGITGGIGYFGPTTGYWGGNGAPGGGGGGGGGGAPSFNVPQAGGNGGQGLLRIIWGSGRAFPSTNTGNV